MYKSAGFISYFLRRLTGIALVLYLFIHMWVIGSVNLGPAEFDARLSLVQTPFFKLAEIALLAAVVYHAFDGIRLMIINWFDATTYRMSMFWATMALAVILTIAGGLPILLFALE